MRDACHQANRVAEKDPMTMLITGDLGFGDNRFFKTFSRSIY